MATVVHNLRWPSLVAALLSGAATFLLNLTCFAQDQPDPNAPQRISSGLILLYDFTSDGDIVRDRSGITPKLDAKIKDQKAVARFEHGIEIKKDTLIKSETIGRRIGTAVNRSGEVTLEAWIQPANLSQKGPARIFTFSKNSNERNFTLGQEGDKFDFRVRSTITTNNGTPSLASKPGAVSTELTHLVYTHDRTGRTRIYVNGELNVEQMLPGDLTNWTVDFSLAIGNELNKGRPWLGKIHLLAIYDRDLLPHEVRQSFAAGEQAKTSTNAVQKNSDAFVSKVAPILAKHCIECHDSGNQEGGLDLSRRSSALAGGDSGKSILAGKPYDSSFWTLVVSNEMPQDRPPLSAKQKQILKEWIDAGAKWTGGDIEPTSTKIGEVGGIWVRRLTVSEYIATVKSSLGVDIEKEARKMLPPDLRADGFNNTAYNLNVDLKHVDAYAKLAELIVERMDVEDFVARFSKNKDWSDSNLRQLIGAMGKWLLRGPLEDHEYDPFLRIAQTVENTGGSFDESGGFILESMLQSPRFMYLIENQRGDGSRYPAGDYELASRLSYILWGGPPDATLMDSVDRGELYDRTGVEEQVKRMLKDPRAVSRSIEFLVQWLNLDRLENLKPDAGKFPDWDPQLAIDMRRETIEFFKEIVWRQERPLVEVLNAQVTFATPRLAKHYELPSNVSFSTTLDEELQRYDLSTNPARGGLLSHGSLLTMGGDEASMVTRGLFVLKDLMRGSINGPPPGVDTTPVPTKAGLTQRMIAEDRIGNPNCGGCHSKIEPLAFGLERFDGVGAYHTQDEHGNNLRDDGEMRIPGITKPVSYASSAELMDLLAKSDRVKESLTWKVTQFALGRPLSSADAPYVRQIHAVAQKNGGTYRSLISAIVLSDLVQSTATEKRK